MTNDILDRSSERACLADDKDMQIKLIDIDIDLYKFHLDIVVKLGTLMFAVTGGIISYSIANYNSHQKFALLLPLVMNIAMAFLFFSSYGPAKELTKDNRRALRYIGFEQGYDLDALGKLLLIFGLVYSAIALGIVVLLGVDLRAPAIPKT